MAVRILLVSEYFFPKTTGGTELYVYNLAKALKAEGHHVTILTCSDSESDYEFDEIQVICIPFNSDQRPGVIKEKLAPNNLSHFINKIKSLKIDVVHFHTLTTSINLFHITETKKLGFRIVLTSHIPGHICLRGDLVHLNKEVCDGVIESHKCLSCFHHSRGIKFPLNHISAAILEYGDYIFPFSDSAKNKKISVDKLDLILDALVVVSDWQRAMFIANGVSEQKIYLCRQALTGSKVYPDKKSNPVFTIGFIGRVAVGKGLHLLLDALSKIDQNLFSLKVAVIPVYNEMDYYTRLKAQAENFKNCLWLENIPNQQVGAFMSSIDLLCVPSIWLETGPFVAYEAFAAGTPVLGSNSGGIKELIIENENGWLFNFNDPDDLLEKINNLVLSHHRNKVFEISKQLMRTSKDMANEMIDIYQKILK